MPPKAGGGRCYWPASPYPEHWRAAEGEEQADQKTDEGAFSP